MIERREPSKKTLGEEMSSSAGGPAEVAVGIVALAGGAVAASCFGVAWILFQGGKLSYNTIKAVNSAVDNIENSRMEKLQISREKTACSLRSILKLTDSFINETEKLKKSMDDLAKSDQLQEMLIDATNIIKDTESILKEVKTADIETVARFTSISQVRIAQLEQMMNTRKRLKETARYVLQEDFQDLIDDVTEVHNRINMQIPDGPTSFAMVSDVKSVSPEEYERSGLWEELMSLSGQFHRAIEREHERAGIVPIPQNMEKDLTRILGGVDERIESLSIPGISNKDLRQGLDRLRMSMEEYRTRLQKLDAIEGEYYKVYSDLRTGLGLSVRDKSDFADTQDLLREIENEKKTVKRAKKCAKLYETLGKDGYICMALNDEMTAMGYSMVDKNILYKQFRGELTQYKTESGTEIPAYYVPGTEQDAMQLYKINEFCQLQVITHRDGSTTLQTIMTGNNKAETVKTQENHCRNLQGLSKRLKEKWFVDIGIKETAASNQVTRIAAGVNNTNMRRDKQKPDTRYQYMQ